MPATDAPVATDAGDPPTPSAPPDLAGRATYVFTRFVILRLLGLVYVVAFLCLVRQQEPLIGAHGLLPAARFLDQVRAAAGSRGAAVLELPTLFWLGCSDAALRLAAWIGLVLAGAV